LYTPQRLFGEVRSATDVLDHEPFLERARLQREQEHDASARLALSAYVVARLVDKLFATETDESAIDGFRWQLDAVRRHIQELPPESPETAHLAGVVAATPEHGRPNSALWMSLTAYAYFLEHEGRLEESLEMLTLAARSQGPGLPTPDFAAYALFAGRLNRQLARWEVARSCYTAAEEAANRTGDLLSALRGRLGNGAVYRGQGNYPMARSIAESVSRDAAESQLPDAQALAYADLGVVYGLQGLTLQALDAHYQAFQLSTDVLKQMRALGDLALGLFEIGAYDAARLAFQIVVNSKAKLLVRINALLELMDLESSTGNQLAFERCRSSAEGYRNRMSPSMLCDYNYKLGMGFARFSSPKRARAALAAGLELAEKHRLNAWYFKIEKAITEMAAEPELNTPSHPMSPLSEDPVVQEMAAGLREYAALAAS
jgi:tetratricopeptide (TPR) repeat protein